MMLERDFEIVEVHTCFDPVSFKLMTVGSGRLSVDYWQDVGVEFNIAWKLEFDGYYIMCWIGFGFW